MKTIILSVDGMTCSACSNGLEKYLNKQNGINNATVNLIMSNVSINYDENILNQEKLEAYIKKAGFTSRGINKNNKYEKESNIEKKLLSIYSILAIILIYISMGHMIHLPLPNIINPIKNPINYTIILFILSSLFIIYGFDILKNGYKNLIHLIPNMDTLVGVGILSSFTYSVANMIKIFNGDLSVIMNLYFESTAIVIYFIKLGRMLEKLNKDKAKDAIKKLVSITPNKATIEKDGKEVTITLDEIKKDNILISKPGEKIAVDGEILVGHAHLDESFITGESKPIEKKIGDKVVAGSLNYDGFIRYKAEKIGRDSTISEMVRLVVEASSSKVPIAKTADKISGYFVPIVMLIAILTSILYLLLGYNFSESITAFVTILVVACPCSLGLATPLAIVVSEGICIKNGILVKKSEILETASKVDTIIFDKTGTLTYGKLKISKIINYSNLDERKIMQLAGSLESKSTHPISKAFIDYLEINNIKNISISDFKEISGLGIVGSIKDKKIILGNNKILEKYSIKNIYSKDEKILSKQGNSIIYVIYDNEIIALIGVNDVVRENSKEVIKKLNQQNIKTVMLTGDNEETAFKISQELGITKVVSNVLPKEKVNIIKKIQKNSYVMMCGDGINDSPALANSDIGVSLKGATDIAMDSANVILMNNDLSSILKLIKISKKTLKNIKQNLFWAFIYNILMIPIAMGILKPLGITLNPIIASLAMVLSSLMVILNTLKLKKYNYNVEENK